MTVEGDRKIEAFRASLGVKGTNHMARFQRVAQAHWVEVQKHGPVGLPKTPRARALRACGQRLGSYITGTDVREHRG